MPAFLFPATAPAQQRLYLDESGTLGFSGEPFTMAMVLVGNLPALEASTAKHRVTQTEVKASQMKTAQKLALARMLLDENDIEVFLASLDPLAAMVSERKLDKELLYDSMAAQALSYYLERGEMPRGEAYRLSMDMRGGLRESYEDMVCESVGNVLMHRAEPLVSALDVRFLDSKYSAGVQAADLFSNIYRTALSQRESPCSSFLEKYAKDGLVHMGFVFGLPELADQMTQIAHDLRARVELERAAAVAAGLDAQHASDAEKIAVEETAEEARPETPAAGTGTSRSARRRRSRAARREREAADKAVESEAIEAESETPAAAEAETTPDKDVATSQPEEAAPTHGDDKAEATGGKRHSRQRGKQHEEEQQAAAEVQATEETLTPASVESAPEAQDDASAADAPAAEAPRDVRPGRSARTRQAADRERRLARTARRKPSVAEAQKQAEGTAEGAGDVETMPPSTTEPAAPVPAAEEERPMSEATAGEHASSGVEDAAKPADSSTGAAPAPAPAAPKRRRSSRKKANGAEQAQTSGDTQETAAKTGGAELGQKPAQDATTTGTATDVTPDKGEQPAQQEAPEVAAAKPAPARRSRRKAAAGTGSGTGTKADAGAKTDESAAAPADTSTPASTPAPRRSRKKTAASKKADGVPADAGAAPAEGESA